MKIPANQLAAVALKLLTQAKVNADDGSLQVTSAVREMLRGIQTGALLVVEKPKPEESPDAAS